MTEDYLSKIKEADETIARIKHEELQDFIIEEIDKRFDQILKGIDLTEQQEQSILRLYNYRVGSENFLKGITRAKAFIALVLVCASLILLVNAGFLLYFSQDYKKFYDNFYKAKYNKDLAEYIEQSKAGAAWSMTESGIEAQALDKQGLIQAFTHCRLKGFVMKKEHGKLACMSDKSGGGWWLPN